MKRVPGNRSPGLFSCSFLFFRPEFRISGQMDVFRCHPATGIRHIRIYTDNNETNDVPDTDSNSDLKTSDDELNLHRSTKNGKGHNKDKHEKGKKRKILDRYGGEKGDIRRPFRRHKPSHSWFIIFLKDGENDEDN